MEEENEKMESEITLILSQEDLEIIGGGADPVPFPTGTGPTFPIERPPPV